MIILIIKTTNILKTFKLIYIVYMIYVYLSDLEDLKDELHTLIFEDEPSIFTEEYAVELVETALYLMEEYMLDNPNAISEPDFHDILLEEIIDIFYIQFEEHIDKNSVIEDDMNEILEDAFNIFITLFYPERSIQNEKIEIHDLDENELNIIQQKIQKLRDIPQPVQRTPEWYNFRWNLITASNAWKAFESQSNINQLIYEKCQPLKNNDPDEDIRVLSVNTNSAMHHGQKYEPLSIMLYENTYNTKVEDFGCIKHPLYSFLGASPDGIIINPDSDRYGRMLEIKNPVSRNITGIPKKEYWVQMQLQMEVCDLDNCDFFETKFVEYSDRKSYEEDCKKEDSIENNIKEEVSETISCDDKLKGVIIQFYTKEGVPFYVYKPLHLRVSSEILKWEEETLTLYESEPYNYTYMKFIYWKLEQSSCIVVQRNHEWFKNNIGQLEKIWKIIEEERKTGYQHRAPVKKIKKESMKPYIETESTGCFLYSQIKKLE